MAREESTPTPIDANGQRPITLGKDAVQLIHYPIYCPCGVQHLGFMELLNHLETAPVECFEWACEQAMAEVL